MNTKHTPGPWELRHERYCGKTDHVIRIGTASVYFNRGIGNTEETAIANARLIAASPDLLEALQSITKSYDELLEKYGKAHGWGTIESDNARAAIAKATNTQVENL